jgi:hypothetical protein
VNGPTVLHLLIGVALLALGVWQLRRRRMPVLGWMLCIGGAAFAASGLPGVHHLLFH